MSAQTLLFCASRAILLVQPDRPLFAHPLLLPRTTTDSHSSPSSVTDVQWARLLIKLLTCDIRWFLSWCGGPADIELRRSLVQNYESYRASVLTAIFLKFRPRGSSLSIRIGYLGAHKRANVQPTGPHPRNPNYSNTSDSLKCTTSMRLASPLSGMIRLLAISSTT